MAEKNNAAARELTLTRIFDAPRELVFQLWTDPDAHHLSAPLRP
jgi:uncharacterized protein YndB with AHSA1/START domain